MVLNRNLSGEVSRWILFLEEELCIFINTCRNSRRFWIFLHYPIHNKSDETAFTPLWGIFIIFFCSVRVQPWLLVGFYYLLAFKHTLCMFMRTEMWQSQKKMYYLNVTERKNAIACISIAARRSVAVHCFINIYFILIHLIDRFLNYLWYFFRTYASVHFGSKFFFNFSLSQTFTITSVHEVPSSRYFFSPQLPWLLS